jgi:CRISPR-associated protein Csd2
VSPQLAANTGFAEGDLTLLWQALTGMFESDRSAARGLMSTRHLIVFKHASVLGDAPAHRLFERVVVRRKNTPARQFVDYAVLLDGQPLSASDLQKEVAAR